MDKAELTRQVGDLDSDQHYAALIWQTDDVRSLALSQGTWFPTKALDEIVDNVHDARDPELGITWEVLRTHVDDYNGDYATYLFELQAGSLKYHVVAHSPDTLLEALASNRLFLERNRKTAKTDLLSVVRLHPLYDVWDEWPWDEASQDYSWVPFYWDADAGHYREEVIDKHT